MKKGVGIVLLIAMFSMMLGMTALAADAGFYNIVNSNNDVVVQPQTAGKTNVEATNEDVDGKEGTETFYPGSERLSVTLNGTKAGEQYLVLLTDDQEAVPSVSTAIWYIDQQSTDTSITFDVYPSAAALSSTKALKLWITSSEAGFTTKTVTLHYYVPYKLGDVNGDGEVDAADAAAALQISANIYDDATATSSLAGDVDGDGDVTPADAGFILQRAANILDGGFPAEQKK